MNILTPEQSKARSILRSMVDRHRWDRSLISSTRYLLNKPQPERIGEAVSRLSPEHRLALQHLQSAHIAQDRPVIEQYDR